MHKHYKDLNASRLMSKRGQVAIFIIVAIVIIGIIAVLYLIPQTRILLPGGEVQEPAGFMRSCVQPEFKKALETVTKQGGSINPSPAVSYQDVSIQYLCYTNENYKPCVVQQPLLVAHVQQEIENQLKTTVESCTSQLRQAYEGRGYQVNLGSSSFNVSIIPERISISFEQPLTLTKESTQTFQSFSIAQSSQLYNLLLTASSIVEFESTLGDSETSLYIQYYPDLKIEKNRREGDTIYKLTNVATKEEFTFATRSLVWPPGYGGQV